MIKCIFGFIIGFIGALAYKLCIPALFILVACKLLYAPYTWNWLNTIIVPLGSGIIGFILAMIADDMVEGY